MSRILKIQFFLCIIWTLVFVRFVSNHSDGSVVLLVIVALLMYQLIFCSIMIVANKLMKLKGHRLVYIPLILIVVSIFIFDRDTFYYFGGVCIAGVVAIVNKRFIQLFQAKMIR